MVSEFSIDTGCVAVYDYSEVMLVERKGSGGRPRYGTPRTTKCERVQVTIDELLLQRLDKFCEDEERARSWVITKAVEQWLSGKGY